MISKKNEEGLAEENTAEAIKNCFNFSGIQTNMAVCAVGGSETAVRHFKFPSLPLEEISGAVSLEASQICPFNVDDGAVDYQLIPGEEGYIDGILVAATSNIMAKRNKFIERASLINVLTDIDGLALLNCFNEIEKNESGHTTAILNVGSTYTNLAIMEANSLPFVRDIAHAGNDIIKEIAEENDISIELASQIICGNSDPRELELGLSGSLDRACQSLITDVTKTLRYYSAQEKSSVIEKIYVCGGFAMVEGFVDLLNGQLPAETILWNPFEKMQCKAGNECSNLIQTNGPALVIAAGLAMRSI